MDRYVKEMIHEQIGDCPDIQLVEGKYLRNAKSKRQYDVDECGFTLHLIGYNDDGELMAVSGYDWTIFKIHGAKFEQIGQTLHAYDTHLRGVMDNPKLLVDEAKIMTVEEIEAKLGHKVIVRQKNGYI